MTTFFLPYMSPLSVAGQAGEIAHYLPEACRLGWEVAEATWLETGDHDRFAAEAAIIVGMYGHPATVIEAVKATTRALDALSPLAAIRSSLEHAEAVAARNGYDTAAIRAALTPVVNEIDRWEEVIREADRILDPA